LSENNNKKDLLKDLIDKRSKALKGGGEKRIESQKNKGKLTARERLSLFF
jgi:acetyl-CoA carboxylase carboxyltransferase component